MKALAFVIASFLVLSFLPPRASAEPEELVVIVNKANPLNVAARDDLRPIFQTLKTEWRDGTRAVPVNLPDDDPLRQSFDEAVLGLDPDRVSRYWIDRKVRGGERPPEKVSSESAALRVVAGNRGGVGYVRESAADKSVKIVARIRKGQVMAP